MPPCVVGNLLILLGLLFCSFDFCIPFQTAVGPSQSWGTDHGEEKAGLTTSHFPARPGFSASELDPTHPKGREVIPWLGCNAFSCELLFAHV